MGRLTFALFVCLAVLYQSQAKQWDSGKLLEDLLDLEQRDGGEVDGDNGSPGQDGQGVAGPEFIGDWAPAPEDSVQGDSGGEQVDRRQVFQRSSYKRLYVTNGGPWGRGWGIRDFCPHGSYAIGYEMKIEANQHRGDDTALNGIRLICGSKSGIPNRSYASSQSGPWGSWMGEVRCNHGQVISSFQLKVEPSQGTGDDTAANNMKVRCRSFYGYKEHERYMGNGNDGWGSYGHWSKSCAANTAVCGIRTSIETPQGRGDDTALNDVELYCCD